MTKLFIQNRSVWVIPLVAVASFLLFAIPPVSTAARHPTRNPCRLVPDTWSPSLDQIRDYVESKSNSETNPSQQVLTLASQNLADLRDAQLFITYVQLMQTLDVKGQSELFEEQKRWLDKRAAAARASVTSKGGTLEPLEYSGAFGKITEERLADLHKRLQRQRSSTEERKEKDKP